MGVAYAGYAMLAAAAVSTYASYQQAEQQEDWHDYQAKQASADAAAEKSAAMIQAERIRKIARRQAGEANAALAASGVKVGEGSALNINEEIYAGAEEDAVTTLFGGKTRAQQLQAQASADRIRGSQAMQAGYLNATSSALQGAASYGNWKTAASRTSTR